MPIYNYRCQCGDFEEFYTMAESDTPTQCPRCLHFAKKIPSIVNLQTDTNFFATYAIDPRVCEGPKDYVEGRKDWQRRLDKKNLRELDWAEVHKKPPVPAPCM